MVDLRVPKRRVPVEVLLSGGAPRRVALFLAEAAPAHGGPERLEDVLNAAGDFLPAFDEESKGMTFLSRRAVAVARLASELEPPPAEEVTIPTEHEVEVTLLDGTRLTGLLSYVRPGNARLIDFLNEPAPFFRLVETGTTALVSRAHVARIAIRES